MSPATLSSLPPELLLDILCAASICSINIPHERNIILRITNSQKHHEIGSLTPLLTLATTSRALYAVYKENEDTILRFAVPKVIGTRCIQSAVVVAGKEWNLRVGKRDGVLERLVGVESLAEVDNTVLESILSKIQNTTERFEDPTIPQLLRERAGFAKFLYKTHVKISLFARYLYSVNSHFVPPYVDFSFNLVFDSNSISLRKVWLESVYFYASTGLLRRSTRNSSLEVYRFAAELCELLMRALSLGPYVQDLDYGPDVTTFLISDKGWKAGGSLLGVWEDWRERGCEVFAADRKKEWSEKGRRMEEWREERWGRMVGFIEELVMGEGEEWSWDGWKGERD